MNFKRAIAIYIILSLAVTPLFFIKAKKMPVDGKTITGEETFEKVFPLNKTFTYTYNFSFELHIHVDDPDSVKISPTFVYEYDSYGLGSAKGYYSHIFWIYLNGEEVYSEELVGYDFAGIFATSFPTKDNIAIWFDAKKDNIVKVVGVLTINVTGPKNLTYLRVKLGPLIVDEMVLGMVPYLGLSPYDYILYIYFLVIAFLVEYSISLLKKKDQLNSSN